MKTFSERVSKWLSDLADNGILIFLIAFILTLGFWAVFTFYA